MVQGLGGGTRWSSQSVGAEGGGRVALHLWPPFRSYLVVRPRRSCPHLPFSSWSTRYTQVGLGKRGQGPREEGQSAGARSWGGGTWAGVQKLPGSELPL